MYAPKKYTDESKKWRVSCGKKCIPWPHVWCFSPWLSVARFGVIRHCDRSIGRTDAFPCRPTKQWWDVDPFLYHVTKTEEKTNGSSDVSWPWPWFMISCLSSVVWKFRVSLPLWTCDNCASLNEDRMTRGESDTSLTTAYYWFRFYPIIAWIY